MKRRPRITAEDRLRQIAADPSLRRTAWESAQSQLARIKHERGQPHAERLAPIAAREGRA